jgi:hypothetical protein
MYHQQWREEVVTGYLWVLQEDPCQYRESDTDEREFNSGFIWYIHAAQCPSAGLGYDVQLLDWLENYTSPLEKKYSDVSFVT